jgi:RND family efflux transporter MFP subunit
MAAKLKFKYLLILLPLLALAGFIGYRVREAVKARSELQQTAGAGQPGSGGQGGRGGQAGRGGGMGGGRTQIVQTGAVSSGKISEKILLTGALKAKEQVDVNPKMQGRLLRVTVDVGQAVARGALIAVLEDDEITQQIERSKASLAVVDASIAQREAELNNAKVELERRRKLIEEGVLARGDLDALETRFRIAQSQLELTRAQRRQSEAEQRELNIRQSYTRVYAPLSGIVARRQLDVGAMASTGTPIITIVSVNPMVIEAKAAERDIARIRRGSPVAVTIDSLPGQKFAGRIMRISPLLDAQTRNGSVEIEIPNRGGALKSEMFARAELALGSQRESTLLPRDALVYRGEQPGVYTIENDAAKFKAVETGLTQEDKVEVVNGLKVGDVVITRGSNLIKEGDRVRVMEQRQGGPGGGTPGGGQGSPGGGPGAGQREGQGGSPQRQEASTQQPPGQQQERGSQQQQATPQQQAPPPGQRRGNQ